MPPSSHATDAETAPPRCPRCGYDLAGLTAAWEDSCPLRGVCSECGLDFDWADLLNPARQRLPWLYEHAERWWNARAAISTALRALIPWSFWRRVQVHHRVVPRRLLVWLAVLLVPLWAATALIGAASGLIAWLFTHDVGSPLRTRLDNRSQAFLVATADDGAGLKISDGSKTTNISDVMFAPGPPVLRETKLGDVLIIRWNKFGEWSRERNPAHEEWIRSEREAIPAQKHPPKYLYRAPDGELQSKDLIIVRVWRRGSPPTFDALVIDPAVRMLGVRVSQGRWPVPSSMGDGLAAGVSTMLVLAPSFLAAAAAIVLASPSEWRRRSVRTVHLLRVLLYGLSPITAHLILAALVYAWAHLGFMVWAVTGGPSRDGWSGWAMRNGVGLLNPPDWIHLLAAGLDPRGNVGAGVMLIPALTILIWLPVYWWFALKRGMRLPRVWALWLFIVIAGIAGSAAIPLGIRMFLWPF